MKPPIYHGIYVGTTIGSHKYTLDTLVKPPSPKYKNNIIYCKNYLYTSNALQCTIISTRHYTLYSNILLSGAKYYAYYIGVPVYYPLKTKNKEVTIIIGS